MHSAPLPVSMSVLLPSTSQASATNTAFARAAAPASAVTSPPSDNGVPTHPPSDPSSHPAPLSLTASAPFGNLHASSPPVSTTTHAVPPVTASPSTAPFAPLTSTSSSSSSQSATPTASSASSVSSEDESGSAVSNVSSVQSAALSAAAHADRQRAHVAESAYWLLLSHVQALSEQVVSASSEAVAQGLKDTLQRAKRGWKQIQAERRSARSNHRHTKERAVKQEQPQLATPSPTAARASQAAVKGQSTTAANGADGDTQQRPRLSTNEDLEEKRRKLEEDGSAVDDEAQEEEEEGSDEDESDEDEEGDDDEEEMESSSAAASLSHIAVAPHSSLLSTPPTATTSKASTTSASTFPPSTPLATAASGSASYQPSGEAVSDAQAPVVMSCSKFPIAVLNVPVQRQYTLTRKDSKRMKRADKEALVSVTVRIMGTPDRQHVYFVAKDVCQLICLRKGSVAKAIHDFSATEKARMPVLCQRSSGSGCTQVVTVLTMAGVRRLMSSSRQPTARGVLQWLAERVATIQANQGPSAAESSTGSQSTESSHTQHAASSGHQQPVIVAEPTKMQSPPQALQPQASSISGSSPYHQQHYSQGSVPVAADVPVSPQVGFAERRPSLSFPNQAQFQQHPNTQIPNSFPTFNSHSYLHPTALSLPSYAQLSSFTSHPSASPYAIASVAQPSPAQTQQQSAPLLPVPHSNMLPQWLGAVNAGQNGSAAGFAAGTHQQQLQANAGQGLFLAGSLSAGMYHGPSQPAAPQHSQQPATPNQTHFTQLLTMQHSPVQQQQLLYQRLVDQQHFGSSSLSLAHPTPLPLTASSHAHPSSTSNLFVSSAIAVALPYNIPSTSPGKQPL